MFFSPVRAKNKRSKPKAIPAEGGICCFRIASSSLESGGIMGFSLFLSF